MNSSLSRTVSTVVEILGISGIAEEDIESQVLALVQNEMFARRLIDCIPEAFGLIFASHLSHLGKITLPTTFLAQDEDGKWQSFAMTTEPIFPAAAEIAAYMFHNGPRSCVEAVCNRSALVATINNALNAGASLEGTTLSGPSLIGIPARFYENANTSQARA